jgi:malate dehydrogenase
VEEFAVMKITVVGCGFVGQTTAMRILEKGLGDVVLIDIVEDKPQGLALDLKEAAPVEGYEPTIVGTNDYADTAGSDLVVITAGFPRQPGMSRMDLLGKNAAIMNSVISQVVPGSPDAIIIVVSNPLDEMTFLAAQASGFPKERVMGMAGVLDSARLRYFIAELTGVSPTKVEAMTLGSHGDAMIALPRQATVDGKPLPELVDEATLQQLFQRTRDGGAEIVGLLKTGSAYYAPSASVGGHGRSHRAGRAHHAARLCMGDRPVRDRGCLRRCARQVGALGRGADRGVGSQPGGAVAAAGSGRGDPRQVRGPREAVALSRSSRRRRAPAAEPGWWRSPTRVS